MRYEPMSVNCSLASQVAAVVAPAPTEQCTCARASSCLRPWASSAPFEGHHSLGHGHNLGVWCPSSTNGLTVRAWLVLLLACPARCSH
jgi:hypothetical protein